MIRLINFFNKKRLRNVHFKKRKIDLKYMEMAKPLVFLSICAFLLNTANAFPYSYYPKRIISLGPDITEEIYILGAEAKLVGCTVYCRRPPEAKNKEKVGTILKISLEKILSLHPDLVLAVSLTDPKIKRKLTSLGIEVITFPSPKNFQEIGEQFLELGRIINKEKEAEKILLFTEKKIDAIKKRAESFQRPRVFVQIGTKPLITINKESFINDFIEYAGGINITKNLKNTRYSTEKVLKDNPDIIIIATMGINGKKEKENWQKFNILKAVRDDRVYSIDSNLLCSPTPVSFAKTLKEIFKILHSMSLN